VKIGYNPQVFHLTVKFLKLSLVFPEG